jgi:hypothetical protein
MKYLYKFRYRAIQNYLILSQLKNTAVMYKIYPPRTVFGEERDKRTRPDTVWPG